MFFQHSHYKDNKKSRSSTVCERTGQSWACILEKTRDSTISLTACSWYSESCLVCKTVPCLSVKLTESSCHYVPNGAGCCAIFACMIWAWYQNNAGVVMQDVITVSLHFTAPFFCNSSVALLEVVNHFLTLLTYNVKDTVNIYANVAAEVPFYWLSSACRGMESRGHTVQKGQLSLLRAIWLNFFS